MTLDEKKKRLENYRNELKELKRFEGQYTHLVNLENLIGNSDTCFAKNAKNDINEEKIRLCKAVSRLIKDKRDIERKIDELENGSYALLLKYRYLDGYSWEEITELLNYSWRSVHYMHNKALTSIAI